MKNNKIIPGTFDPIFKALLSDQNLKDYLCYLISEITDLDYDYLYNNIQFINKDINVDYVNQKQYKTDLLINIENNKINIESNRKNSEGLFLKNNRYQHSLASDMKSGENYNTNFVYQINFNEFNRFRKNNNVLDKVMLMNVNTGEIEEEEYQRYHINLAQIRKKYYNKEEITLFEKRCLILSLTNIKEIEELSKNDEMMERVYKKMKKMNENHSILDLWDEEKELEKARNYDLQLAKEKAEKEGMKQGMKKGMEQGIEQGIEQGMENRNIEIAKNMINKNIDLNLISEVTGLTMDEIKAIN